MKSTKYYQFGNPIKVKFRKHFCIVCGNNLDIKKHSKIINSKSPEAKYYDFSYGETNRIKGDCNFIHKIFYCPKCNKEFEPVTQLSYEDNEKWTNKAYKKLLKFFRPEQIRKAWIDNNENTLNFALDIENLQSTVFIVKVGEKEFIIPCSITGRKKYWERPSYIKKDRAFNKALTDLLRTNN